MTDSSGLLNLFETVKIAEVEELVLSCPPSVLDTPVADTASSSVLTSWVVADESDHAEASGGHSPLHYRR